MKKNLLLPKFGKTLSTFLRKWFALAVLSVLLQTQNICAEGLQVLTEEWDPISFSVDGRPSGLAVEVVVEIMRRLDQHFPVRIVPWARGWKMVTERPNVVLFTTTRTDEREKLFAMVGPVAVGTTNFYVKKGSKIHLETLEDAKKIKKIGVYRSSVEEQLLLAAGFTNLEETSLPVHTAKKLMAGHIDVWCNANLTAGKIMENAGFDGESIENIFTIRENLLYIAFSKGTPRDTILTWKSALEVMKRDGTFTKIYERWLPGEAPPLYTELIGTY